MLSAVHNTRNLFQALVSVHRAKRSPQQLGASFHIRTKTARNRQVANVTGFLLAIRKVSSIFRQHFDRAGRCASSGACRAYFSLSRCAVHSPCILSAGSFVLPSSCSGTICLAFRPRLSHCNVSGRLRGCDPNGPCTAAAAAIQLHRTTKAPTAA